MKLYALALALVLGATSVQSQELVIGMSTETTSIDPHFADLGPNHSVRQHIFDSLVHIGSDNRIEPGLAVEWGRSNDPLVWTFKLRTGVRFHDGTQLSGKDVEFSIARAPNVPNAPSTLSRRVVDIASVEMADDATLRIRTKTPTPLLPMNLAYLAIVSSKVGDKALPEDFNNGKHAIGTGPYKLVEFRFGDRLVLAPNPDYWGGKPHWQKVTMKPLTNARSRLAALLAGDVDVIADVPLTDIPRLKSDPRFNLAEIVSNRIIFWSLDVFRDQAQHITDLAGKPIANPLKDLRVRQAMSFAIDRQAIVERVMDGMAIAAGQIVPEGFAGFAKDLQAPKPDLDQAKKLMAEAGYPDGFQMTFHTTNDRYVNDAKTAQTVAQMLARIGIKGNVAALPVATYYGPARNKEFTMPQIGWGNLTGDAEQVLRESLVTGSANNYGRWSNPEFDRLMGLAQREIDLAKREDYLREATRVAMKDVALIPTHWQVNIWASKKGLRYLPRIDELTFAMNVVPE